VAVCAQELAREKKHSPKLQALIYPWVQMYDHKLPSMIEYRKKHSITTLTPLNLTLCYLGRLNPKKAMIECLKNNEHMLLLDEQTRLKYESFINPQLIPDEYKKDRAYYETYRNSHANRVAKTLKPNSVLNTDLEFRKEILNLFNKKVSPLLADDEDLKDLPPAYFQLLEWDMLKDEGLIYSERLRLNGCKVHVELFEKAFHGIAPSLDYTMGFEAARHMFNNMVDKLKEMV
jgi:acetyl esterase/lipase